MSHRSQSHEVVAVLEVADEGIVAPVAGLRIQLVPIVLTPRYFHGTVSGMDRTDDRRPSPDREDPEAWRGRQRPDNEVPGSVAFEAVLGESEDLAIFVCGLSVYRNGVELALEVRARPSYADSRHDESEFLGGAVVRGGLLLGAEFADGRRCSNLPGRREKPLRLDQPVLWSDGGGGGGRSAAVSWFLSPLPPPGELRIICAWPGRGIPESITTLPAEPILAAAARARELWPWQPERQERSRIPRTEVPAAGWFAENAPPPA